MIRALITAAILAAAIHYASIPPDTAIPAALLVFLTLWYLHPALKWLTRVLRSMRTGTKVAYRFIFRRRRHRRTPAATPKAPARQQPTHLTQIVNNHFYAWPQHLLRHADPVPGQLGIPQYGEQQLRHNEIFGGHV